MQARTPSLVSPKWIVLVLLTAFALPAMAQNTKGDKPVNNERQIRQTKGKSIKRKDKAKTRDIAGRRLRTKDKSSANSANVGIRQPNPYYGRRRTTTDRAAKPRGRVYAEKPSEKPRVTRGDISGHPIRTSKPRRTEAARANVYPQSGEYVRFGSSGLRGEHPPKYKETASGRPIIKRVPQQKERAWKGDIRGQKVTPPRSITRQHDNTFPQANQYSQYVKRKFHQDRPVSNQREIARTKQLSSKPKTSGPGGGYISAGNKGFGKRGRKNVYWGKFSKGEKPVTTDIAGGPILKRNYRSPSAGLVGRDTLQHFGHRPGGDVSADRKGRELPGVRSSPSGKNWRGDISGHRLRQARAATGARAQLFGGVSSASRSGQVGKPLPSYGISRSPKGEQVGKRVPPKGFGIGGIAIAEDMRRLKGGPSKGFTPQGEGFAGYMKVKRRQGGYGADGFSGNMRGQSKTFENQGEGFSGYIKSQRPVKGGGSISGKLWNNNGAAIGARNLPGTAELPGRFSGNLRAGQKLYQDQGEEFTGYIKTKRPYKGGGSVSGKLWNNRNTPIENRDLPSGATRPGLFSGNIKATQKGYGDQGEEFTGYIKAKKPLKGGGSVSGKLWNNSNAPIENRDLPSGATRPGLFSGNIKSSQKAYEDQGEEFTGYIKTKKPLKGGGSVSGKLWNNRESTITDLDTKSASITASRFEGRSKSKTGKPSSAGFEGQGKFTVKKAAKPSEGLFDSEGKARLKEDYTQSPKAVEESTKKHRPERVGFQAEGLQVRVAKKDYDAREHSVKGALPGEGPNKGSIRASQFSSGFRVTADRRHNPNSADEALKGTYYGGKTTAQMGAFHGNVKVKKFEANRKLHPDAKFAHGPDNNVDDERTFFTNVKLWWTKLFHDSESQPANVKEKERRPRYDKREQGMWAE